MHQLNRVDQLKTDQEDKMLNLRENIGAILFDLGKVVRTELEDFAAEHLYPEVGKDLADRAIRVAWKVGDTSSDDVSAIWAETIRENCPTKMAVDELIEKACKSIKFRDEVTTLRTLRRVRALGIKLIVASDDHAWTFNSWWPQSGLEALFDAKVVSAFTGHNKSDPQFWRLCRETLPSAIQPEDCIFLDDRTANVLRSSRWGGFVGLYVEGPKHADQLLARLGI